MIDLNHHEWQRLGNEGGFSYLFLRHRYGAPIGGAEGSGEGKRFFERGKFKVALLDILASEPMHGYQVIKAMEEKTGGLYTPSPGSVYPNLQLLEDMQLISCNETDGKKLYRITNEGLRYLRKMEKEAAEQHKNLWEHLRRHDKHGGGHGKHLFRALMKEWPDVIHLIAKATEAAKVAPSSQQTTQFHELMSKFQKDLNELLTSTPNPNTDKTVPNDNRPED